MNEEGICIAPLEVAKCFSHERMIPEVRDISPFSFINGESVLLMNVFGLLKKFTNK